MSLATSRGAPGAYHSHRDLLRGERLWAWGYSGVSASSAAGRRTSHSVITLSDIKGGIATVRLLRDLLCDSMLRFIPAPPDVRQRALHDPESVLPHVMAAAELPPLPLTIPVLKFSQSHSSDLIRHADNTLEPILTSPLGLYVSREPDEHHQRCGINEARHRPISNPESKHTRARKIGALTSSFVLDQPARPSLAQCRVLKPPPELRLPVMVSDHLGGYSMPARDGGEADEIESFPDSEGKSEERDWAKQRLCV
ncbi:hypothetical protein GSI_05095 [Ganoderma sinense ZZ0214-1]|uniref:Uncharacterized protein n=1 Tax=Ganoderma sinense ZZ0214-1 TaxID=1077348 RepID=A0A2G8SH01_9APHY|nr:hypothetical protein GSI_05095 [Ganoderma sinense ZZ0214-1]